MQTIEIQDFHSFIFDNHLLSTLELHMHLNCFKDLIFVDDKLPAKKRKLRASKMICTYTIFSTSDGKQCDGLKPTPNQQRCDIMAYNLQQY